MLDGIPIVVSFSIAISFSRCVKPIVVIAPDHIGCGLSDKPSADRYGYPLQNRIHDVEALLDHLQIRERITLVLHDWGWDDRHGLRHSSSGADCPHRGHEYRSISPSQRQETPSFPVDGSQHLAWKLADSTLQSLLSFLRGALVCDPAQIVG